MIAVWAMAVLVAGVVAALLGAGYHAYVVRTASMAPALSPGDIVIDVPATGRPAVGEIVTFTANGPDGVITHRVDAVNGEELHTKGDANRTADVAPVPISSIVGKVAHVIPHAGYLIVYLRQPAGVASVVALVGMVMLAWSMFFDDEPAAEPIRARGRVRLRIVRPA